MEAMKNKEIWFIAGSQDLYGAGVLKTVAEHAAEMAEYINKQQNNPVTFKFKDVVKNTEQIADVMRRANNDAACAGVMTWMHTFSPSKMWIKGLTALNKPLLHLHTQYNEKLPYGEIDMDFMNLNQAAHGDREFGYMCTRLKIRRKVVAGYYKDGDVLNEIFAWARAAAAAEFSKNLNVVRFGDNMREVGVTDGDKAEAEKVFGWAVNGYGIGALADYVSMVTKAEIDALMSEYASKYSIVTKDTDAVRVQASYEIALRKFLSDNKASAFTTNFQELHNMKQLPGLACQRLMGEGIGFGGEGDWKTSALNAVMAYMAQGKKGGTSFMEDYTYHLEKGRELILGAHMLEVSPDIADGNIKIDVLPLSIGGKEPPARMIFDSITGPGLVATVVDLGDRFRMIVNKIELVKQPQSMPKLPVARAMWKALPDFKTSAAGWIYAGGAHHTVLSTALTAEEMIDLGEIFGIETIIIGENTRLDDLRKL